MEIRSHKSDYMDNLRDCVGNYEFNSVSDCFHKKERRKILHIFLQRSTSLLLTFQIIVKNLFLNPLYHFQCYMLI